MEERRVITRDLRYIKREIREYYEQFYDNYFDNLDEKFLETKLSKATQEEIEKLNKPRSIK